MDLPVDRAATETRPPLTTLVAEAVVLFLVLRLGLSLLGAIIASTDVWSPCHFEEALNGWQTMPELMRDGPAFPLVGVWERWDACWYLKIATFGYEPGERSAAFFPLFPAAVRLAGTVSGLPYPVAGLIVSGLAFVAATTGLLSLVVDSHGQRIGHWTVRLLAVFPSAFFLLAPFTESLFLATAVWALVFARQHRWWLVTLCAALAGLTRAQGVLLAVPLAWEAFSAARHRRAAGSLQRARDWLPIAGSLVAIMAPVVALIGWVWAVRVLTGETPYDAQSVWGGTNFHPPWAVVAASTSWIVERGDAIQAVNLASLLGAGVLLIVGARRMPLSYSLYAWPPLLLLATRIQPTPLTSTSRLAMVIFPVFVVAAILVERSWLRWAWVFISLLLLVALATQFLRGDFVA